MQVVKNITLLLLAGLTFISSTGFSMYKHYCGDNLKDISLFEEAASCHESEAEDMPMEACPFHQHTNDSSADADDCCSDEYNYIELEEQQQLNNHTEKVTVKAIPVKDLGFKEEYFEENSLSTSCITTSANEINAPPLYIQYVQFSLYG